MTRGARRYLLTLVAVTADPHWCPWCNSRPSLAFVGRYGSPLMECRCGKHWHDPGPALDCWCSK